MRCLTAQGERDDYHIWNGSVSDSGRQRLCMLQGVFQHLEEGLKEGSPPPTHLHKTTGSWLTDIWDSNILTIFMPLIAIITDKFSKAKFWVLSGFASLFQFGVTLEEWMLHSGEPIMCSLSDKLSPTVSQFEIKVQGGGVPLCISQYTGYLPAAKVKWQMIRKCNNCYYYCYSVCCSL